MVVPFAAGGPTDTIGRVVAEGMRASLGQPIIIENVTGAAGRLGLAGLPAQLPMATRSVLGSGVATSLTEQFTRSHTT